MVWREDRRLLRVHGRAPARMLNGILTCRVPEPPVGVGGDAVCGTILTPKGRMVTDLVTLWLGAGGEEGLGLSVATCGVEAVLGHFNRFLPPRLARVEDLGDRTGLLTVLGPEAGDVVAAVFGAAPAEGFVLVDGGPRGEPDGGGARGALVARAVEQVPSWDVWLPAAGMETAWERLGRAGAMPVGQGVWDTLRVEAGYPAYGTDMDETTIPVEAGLLDRAFDHDKGCYTGQEVIGADSASRARQLASARAALRRGCGQARRPALRGRGGESARAGDFGGAVAAVRAGDRARVRAAPRWSRRVRCGWGAGRVRRLGWSWRSGSPWAAADDRDSLPAARPPLGWGDRRGFSRAGRGVPAVVGAAVEVPSPGVGQAACVDRVRGCGARSGGRAGFGRDRRVPGIEASAPRGADRCRRLPDAHPRGGGRPGRAFRGVDSGSAQPGAGDVPPAQCAARRGAFHPLRPCGQRLERPRAVSAPDGGRGGRTRQAAGAGRREGAVCGGGTLLRRIAGCELRAALPGANCGSGVAGCVTS